jgi:hypothetical protein
LGGPALVAIRRRRDEFIAYWGAATYLQAASAPQGDDVMRGGLGDPTVLIRAFPTRYRELVASKPSRRNPTVLIRAFPTAAFARP